VPPQLQRAVCDPAELRLTATFLNAIPALTCFLVNAISSLAVLIFLSYSCSCCDRTLPDCNECRFLASEQIESSCEACPTCQLTYMTLRSRYPLHNKLIRVNHQFLRNIRCQQNNNLTNFLIPRAERIWTVTISGQQQSRATSLSENMQSFKERTGRGGGEFREQCRGFLMNIDTSEAI